jgi:MFS family permease
MSEVLTETEIYDDLTAEEKKPNPLALLRNWDFSALFLGGFINNVGSYFTSVAIIFLGLAFTSGLTENEATRAIALMTTFTLTPMLLLGPVAGVLVDKFDRKKVMIIADFLGAVAAFGLIFATQMWHLYLFALFNSSVRQFFYPAKTASIPRIVKQDQLLSANGFIQTTSQLSRLIGPLIAGFLVAAVGFDIAFIVDGCSYIVSAVLLFTIRRDLKPEKTDEKLTIRSVGVGLKDGFKLAFTDKIITFVIILFSFTILMIGMIDPLIVPYMNFEFGVGEQEFGMMMSFAAISGLILAIILSVKGQLKKKLTFMSVTILIASVCLGFLALAPFLPGGVVWIWVGMILVGCINVGFNLPFSTLLQRIVPNKDLGKISGVIDTVITAASVTASAIAATLAGVISTSWIFIIITICIAVAGIVGLVVIKVMNLEKIAQLREEKMMAIAEKEGREKKDKELDIDFDNQIELTFEEIKSDDRRTPHPTID